LVELEDKIAAEFIQRKHFNNNHVSTTDTCTELPAAVSDMTTTSTFPVIVGTVVEVSCKPGHTLTGDNTITCIRDISFTIGHLPTCTIGLRLRGLILVLKYDHIFKLSKFFK